MKKIVIIIMFSKIAIAQNIATIVKDIKTTGTGNSGISSITKLGSKVIFSAIDDINGNEPWVSDGTSSGTVLLKDINPGSGSSGSGQYCLLGSSKVLFVANNLSGIALYSTDGTSSGTILLKQYSVGSSIGKLTEHGSKLYFMADDGISGQELWSSDGTSSGTVLVKDINTTTLHSYPQYMCSHSDGKIYFMADDGISGSELWSSDGTSTGTVLVKDIIAGSSGSYPTNMFSFGGKIYFAGYDLVNKLQLWSSDGTSSGTVLFKIINPLDNSFPTQFINLGLKFIFLAENNIGNQELWSSDGTSTGTILVKDINGASVGSNLTNISKVSSAIVFSANDGVNGQELWISDGTSSGTVLLKDINPGSGSAAPGAFYLKGTNELFMSADNGSGRQDMIRYIIGVGTSSVYCNINSTASPSPSSIFEIGSDLFCVANGDTYGEELYKIEPASTISVKEISQNQIINIYPNPTNSIINIDLDVFDFKIFNSLGELIKVGRNTPKIDLGDVSQGVYYLRIGSSINKIIKE